LAEELQVSTWTVIGIFLITLATLMDEILVTRIFSVTMWYHFAFGAISLAMFGMTVGALHVHQHPQLFTTSRAKRTMSVSSFWFAVNAIASVLAHLSVPLASNRLTAIVWISMSYVLFSVPFYFSGIAVCVALTKFPQRAGLLYAADLVGAGIGCAALIVLLKFVDVPSATIIVGIVGCLSSIAFAVDGRLATLRRIAVLLSLALGVVAFVTASRAASQSPLLRITWAKGQAEPRPIYEKWNSFSRIAVDGNPSLPTSVITEGLSQTYPTNGAVLQLHLRIDAGAETSITSWKKPEDIEYLKYDVKNIVHHIRNNGSVLIIGAGGGRDVLSALLMGQKSVRAVEINQNILETLNSRFGTFSDHLDRNPRIRFVNDEARSYIARTNEHFDVIEASFIDTWAATAAGALTLTENSLYTVDAWRLFLDRLSPNGILSFSRWYSPEFPAESYRIVSLAAAALQSQGVTEPRAHIVLISNIRNDFGDGIRGAATLLVGKEPLSHQELDTLEKLSRQMQFHIILSPRTELDPIFSSLGEGRLPAVRSLPLNLSPPTDDCPFFFYIKPLRYAFRNTSSNRNSFFIHELQSGEVVIVLFLLVVFLTVFFVLVPLVRNSEKAALRGSAVHLLFFAAIGMGFMLVEVSQMQRLIVFLGHPTYSLSVVLSTLLVTSGLGSYASRRLCGLRRNGIACMLLLLFALLAFGLSNVPLIAVFASSTTPVRIVLAICMLIPPAFFMGMAFPLGLKVASMGFEALIPAFWGMNGAASICASVLAMLIAMNAGISATFWFGFFWYAVAAGAYFWTTSIHRRSPDLEHSNIGRTRMELSPKIVVQDFL